LKRAKTEKSEIWENLAMRFTWVALAGAAVALGVFLGLAWEVRGDDSPVWRIDRAVASAMKEHAADHPAVLQLARDWTDAGGVPVMTALAIVGSLLLWMCGQQRLAACWLLAAALGCVFNMGSKAVFDRMRPGESLRDEAVQERNASFPSGHAMGSMIGYGTLAYAGMVLLRRRAAHVALVTGLTVLVLAIGSSRVYLRAHWLSDVVGGFALGGFWLALCILLLRREPRR
jgi:membrane-associated phospholipid phosphatase